MEGDAPLVTERPQTCFTRWVHQTFLQELPIHLRWAYLWFGCCLILLIGSQGFIFPVRTALFYDIIENKVCRDPTDPTKVISRCDVAAHKDAIAKALLPLVQLPLVIIFNWLWGRFKRPALIIVLVCSFFTVLFVPIWIGLEMGGQADLENQAYTHNEMWLAYLTYYSVELKAVICPVMIWCVVNDLTPPKLAKIAYPPIVFAIQVGTVIGSFMAAEVNWFGGNRGLVIIQVFCLVAAAACGLVGLRKFRSGPMPEIFLNQNQAAAPPEAESCVRSLWSMVEGLWLIATHPYLLCTAWCSVAHLVPRLFLDFQGTQVVKNWCNTYQYDDYDNCKTSFFGWVNLIQALLTMLLALCGTRRIVELGGLRLSLSVLPIFAIVGNLFVFLTIHVWGTKLPVGKHLPHGGWLPNVWVTQIAIIMMNTFGYGLNGPSREMLYVKTARDMKYKAKSWSDMYGNNGMKSFASIINANYNSTGTPNIAVTVSIASSWVVLWLGIVQWVGLKHKSLMDSGDVVGEKGVGRWRTSRPL